MHYHARYYDRFVSRFLSPDTIVEKKGDPQTRNRYSYVQNNPLNHTDPTGHCAPCGGAMKYGDEGGPVEGESTPAGLNAGGAANSSDTTGEGDGVPVEVAGVNEGWTNGEGDPVKTTSSSSTAGWVEGSGDSSWGDAANTGDATTNDPGNVANDICSFSSDTQVATGDGKEQAIGDLKVGDKVLAYDQRSGIVSSYPVIAVLAHPDPAIEYLTIDDEQLTTTPEHPFYTQGQGWTPAGQLWQGAHIKKADERAAGTVQSFKVVQHRQTMYNLTVADAHTFFVGTKRWLVHNTCNWSPGNSGNPDTNA